MASEIISDNFQVLTAYDRQFVRLARIHANSSMSNERRHVQREWLIALSQVDLNVVCCPDQVAPGGYDGGVDGQGAVADGISKGVPRRDELRGVFVRTALAGRLRLPGVRQWSGGGAEEPGIHL